MLYYVQHLSIVAELVMRHGDFCQPKAVGIHKKVVGLEWDNVNQVWQILCLSLPSCTQTCFEKICW